MKAFEQIDSYFKEKDKKEFYYVLVGIIFLIGFLFIYYLYPITMDYRDKNLKKYNDTQNKLNQEINNLASLKKKNIDLTNELKIKTNKLISLKKEETFYSQLVSVLDFATFNRYKWADFVKNMINDAGDEGLKVEVIKNEIVDNSDSNTTIVKNMIIDMKVKGSYKNFIHYLYQYEKLKDLIRIEKMVMDSNDSYEIEIDIYGYKK